MRPAAFYYHAPATIDEALDLLAVHGADARIIAGGQSLVPAMSARLARPAHLIDINRVAHAERPAVAAGRLRIPPLARHIDFESGVVEGPLGHILAALHKHAGPLPVLMRGTFCGAIAHADPASAWCLAAVTLNAEITVRSKSRGVRTVPAATFFETIEVTVAEDDEMVVEVQIPLPDQFVRFGFSKVAPHSNHYGAASCLCVAEIDDRRAFNVRLGVGAVEDVPRRLTDVEELLERATPGIAVIREAAALAASFVSPIEQPGINARDQRELTQTVVRHALEEALL
ncbi:MAG: FAD binding domain-containing protein [Pseudomonadota bacterium]